MLVVCPGFSFAAYPDATTTVGPVIIPGCYDGDTCTISIPTLPGIFGDRLSLRLVGIDTPEMKGKCDSERMLALQAKAFLTQRLEQAQTIDIELVVGDKYFRVLLVSQQRQAGPVTGSHDTASNNRMS